MEKMQEYLDHYSELVNKGEKSLAKLWRNSSILKRKTNRYDEMR